MGHRWDNLIRAGLLACSLLLIAAAPAAAKPDPKDPPPPADEDKAPAIAEADLNLRIEGLEEGRAQAGTTVAASGRIKPYVKGEKITLKLLRDGKTIRSTTSVVKAAKGGGKGRFELESKRLLESGRYQFIARKKASKEQGKDLTRSRTFKISYPDLDPGDSSDAVAALRRLLQAQGYYAPGGSSYDDHLSRAILAYRKVNNMERTTNATPEIFKQLASGRGGFKLDSPGAGKHVEIDVSRQVMVLANKGEPVHIFHVSTGAPATPSDYGFFRFYRKDPGFNSLGMYYSVYYNRGEATHGYHSVPTYPASHGCIRNPIPDSVFIYNWIDLGDPMIVYP